MSRRACRSQRWRGIAIQAGRVVLWAPIGPTSSHLFYGVRPDVARVLMGQRVDSGALLIVLAGRGRV